MAEKLPNGNFRLSWKTDGDNKRISFNVYRSETDDFDIDKAENILAAGLRDNKYEYRLPEKDKAYYYFVTVSDSYHNESVISHPAFFYHSDTIK